LIASAFGSCGCATTAVQMSYWRRDPGVRMYVFGGTAVDASAVYQSVQPDAGEASIAFLMIFDLPFSLVADVLLLPLCIYQQVERGTWEEGEFIARLDGRDKQDRLAAARALGCLEGTTEVTVDALARALEDEHPDVREQALASLAALGTRSTRTAPAVIARLDDAEVHVRSQAARALPKMGADPGLVIPALLRATEDPSSFVRCAAILALGEIGGADAAVIQALERLRKDESADVRGAAEEVLARSLSAPRPAAPRARP
jgi:uncharacterized protein YceK